MPNSCRANRCTRTISFRFVPSRSSSAAVNMASSVRQYSSSNCERSQRGWSGHLLALRRVARIAGEAPWSGPRPLEPVRRLAVAPAPLVPEDDVGRASFLQASRLIRGEPAADEGAIAGDRERLPGLAACPQVARVSGVGSDPAPVAVHDRRERSRRGRQHRRRLRRADRRGSFLAGSACHRQRCHHAGRESRPKAHFDLGPEYAARTVSARNRPSTHSTRWPGRLPGSERSAGTRPRGPRSARLAP